MLEPRFEAAAVCSRSQESGKRFAEAHCIGKVYTDVDEMASDPEIDAIYIGTPNDTHHDIAIKCLRHHKHVLCEKPMASNACEVSEMVKAARENGVMLMEAMISTLCPNFVAARKHLAGMGAVRHYFASFCQYSSKYDLVKRIIAGEEDSPVPSSLNPERCGGALMDIGIYTVFPMVALFGRPRGIKAEVTTCEVPVRLDRKEWKRIDLQGSVIFEYDGMSASVIYSKIADSNLLHRDFLRQRDHLAGSDPHLPSRRDDKARRSDLGTLLRAGDHRHFRPNGRGRVPLRVQGIHRRAGIRTP